MAVKPHIPLLVMTTRKAASGSAAAGRPTGRPSGPTGGEAAPPVAPESGATGPGATGPGATDWTAVGARVREARSNAGLSQADLGALLGTTQSDVSQLEGGRQVSEAKLARVAEALGASVRWLRYGEATSGDLERQLVAAYQQGFRDAMGQVRDFVRRVSREGTPVSPREALGLDAPPPPVAHQPGRSPQSEIDRAAAEAEAGAEAIRQRERARRHKAG